MSGAYEVKINQPPRPRVLIATPTTGSVRTIYMRSLIATMRDLGKRGIDSDIATFDGSDIIFQRNMLAQDFLDRTGFTHLFFYDSDMAIPDALCARMIAAQKPIIGAIASKKGLHFDRVIAGIEKGRPFHEAIAHGYDWVISPADRDRIDPKTKDGIIEVQHVGMATTLIQRDVLTAMINKAAAKRNAKGDVSYHMFFNPRLQDVEADFPVPEDYSFCRRWTVDCGGKIFAVIDALIFHIGDYAYGGRYRDLIK